jgi:hypothetical protein
VAYLLAVPAGAQPARVEAVLVLEAPNGLGWKEGVQALVAELLTTGHELRVRAARAHSLAQLEQELQLEIADSGGASTGVSITREGTSATALLCRRGVGSCERVQMTMSDGELSRSRLALALVDRLRPIDLPAAPAVASAPAPPETAVAPPERVPPRAERPNAEPPGRTGARPIAVWAGGGVVLSSGMSAPLVWLSASLGLRITEPWGIELGVGGSPLAGSAESHAGSLSVRAFQATAFATFEPLSARSLGLGLGLGGGALRLQETASPAPGFEGFSRHTTVGVVSARARLFLRLGPLYWGLSLDPGMLVPAVKVQAGTETVLRIGRPWLALQTSLGMEL